MTRRQAVLLLASAPHNLDRFFDPARGTALVADCRTTRIIAMGGSEAAQHLRALPGSTLKPFVLATLLESGRLREDESLLCPGRLRILNRELNCSHPRLDTPMRIDTAIAYSCNYFVAHAAARLKPRELASVLERAGFGSHAPVPRVANTDAQRLQALGEESILITAAELASAYRRLARNVADPILRGLEGAVEYGTARLARLDGVPMAGKTGSAFAPGGEPIAWFAGFVPSRAPEAAIAVMLEGRSGGADAAPVAGRILAAYRAGRL